MMTNQKHSQSIFTDDTKQDCVRKTVDKTSANVFRNDAELGRAREDSLNGCIYLEPDFFSEAWLPAIVICHRFVEIGRCEVMILNSHPSPPPVRLINSVWLIASLAPDSSSASRCSASSIPSGSI